MYVKHKMGSEFLGITSFPNVHVAELPGIGEKVQTDNLIFTGLKSLSVVLQLFSRVGGVREGCPRSEQGRSLSFAHI